MQAGRICGILVLSLIAWGGWTVRLRVADFGSRIRSTTGNTGIHEKKESFLSQSNGFQATTPLLSPVALALPVVSNPSSLEARNPKLETSFAADPKTRARLKETFGKLPLFFEANRGQTGSTVKFLFRGPGFVLFLTPKEAVVRLRIADCGLRNENGMRNENRLRNENQTRKPKSDTRHPAPDTLNPSPETSLRMRFIGANPNPQMAGLDPLGGQSNYFVGSDPTNWKTNVPQYARVCYKQIYPGINLVFYGNQRQLEYDFLVAPGADPSMIALAFEEVNIPSEPRTSVRGPASVTSAIRPSSQDRALTHAAPTTVGHRRLQIDSNGDLVIKTAAGEIRQLKPSQLEVRGQEDTMNDSGAVTFWAGVTGGTLGLGSSYPRQEKFYR